MSGIEGDGNKNIPCEACDATAASLQPDLPFRGLVEGEEVTYIAPGYKCSSCGVVWSTGAEEAEHDWRKSDAYRRKYDLLTSEEMEGFRHRLSMKKAEFCDYIGVPRMTYDRWLKGIVQGASMDRAVRSKVDRRQAILSSLHLAWLDYKRSEIESTGKRDSTVERLFSLISFFVTRTTTRPLGALYLNKLCWYSDQAAYNLLGEAISGTPYIAMEHGPVIKSYDEVFRAMEWCGYLQKLSLKSFAPGTRMSDLPSLEGQSAVVAEYVWSVCKSKLEKLRDDSHKEVGWLKTPPLEIISFSHSKNLKCLDQSKLQKILQSQ